MTDEALPQAHQPTTLVFGPDFGADPLWHRSPTGQTHMANLDRLPLSASLRAELRTWARRHDELQDPPNPVRGTAEDVAAWQAHGESLLTALREELGPDYVVIARSDLPRALVRSPAEESARQLPTRSQRPGIVRAFTVVEHRALGQQIAPMCQKLLWTVGDVIPRYGRHDPLSEQAVKAHRAVHELRTLLEAELAQAHPDRFDERAYYPHGPDRGPYDRPS